MKRIIAILVVGATLFASINVASAQALPTNPPTPQEGGAPRP
jgi:hypothetical protein